MGRYYAMDRDNRWERVEKAYAAMVYGEGETAECPVCAMEKSYEADVTDEFVVPVVCDKDGGIRENDSVIFFNFRPDRAREITRTLVDPDFDGFERRKGFFPLYFVCMTQYDAAMPNVHVAFKPQCSGEHLWPVYFGAWPDPAADRRNGKVCPCYLLLQRRRRRLTLRTRIGRSIASPKVATYDLKPEMSAYEVCRCGAAGAFVSGKYDVVILNFANCDMVGHTGVFDAAVSRGGGGGYLRWAKSWMRFLSMGRPWH